ncbi:MAG: DUF3800 domain-containing protein [Rhodobacteraceae bacterium]|nr:DUF3800 domain-containing protein [Paracoccaceae bacterium]
METRNIRDRKLSELSQYQEKRKKYKRDFAKIEPYTHLTQQERKDFLEKISVAISKWDFARLFADCIDKNHFEPVRAGGRSVGEEAFDQIISRFNTYLRNKSSSTQEEQQGIIVHDNSPEIAAERMQMMRAFIDEGTRHLDTIDHVIETPLFVDSKLTSMVQIADLCAYALRRYIENGERFLFDKIFQIADRKQKKLVGIRHFTASTCSCLLCSD